MSKRIVSDWSQRELFEWTHKSRRFVLLFSFSSSTLQHFLFIKPLPSVDILGKVLNGQMVLRKSCGVVYFLFSFYWFIFHSMNDLIQPRLASLPSSRVRPSWNALRGWSWRTFSRNPCSSFTINCSKRTYLEKSEQTCVVCTATTCTLTGTKM